MSLDIDRPEQIVVRIKCPKCGAAGTSVWEDEKGGPFLVSLSSGFYERLAKFSPYRIEIVCNACGTRQPGQEPR